MLMFTTNGIKTIKLLATMLLTLALMLFPHLTQEKVHAAQKNELEIIVLQQSGIPAATAEIHLHNPSGMAAGQLEVVYESGHFTVQNVSRAALLEQGSFNFETNTSQAGVIKAAWFALKGTTQGGPLFTVTFHGEGDQPLNLELKNILLYGEDGSSIPLAGSASGEIKLQIGKAEAWVNGVSFPLEMAPFIREGRTMVPVRFVSEQLGAAVEWLPETGQVRIEDGARSILLTINSARALVDGGEETLDAPAVVSGGRTFVPLRFVSETLGARVVWHGETNSITIGQP